MTIVIIGAGGFGREILDVLDAASPRWPGAASAKGFAGFLDDGQPDLARLGAIGAPFLGPSDLLATTDHRYLIGVGDSHVREALDDRARAWGRQAAVAVHESATIGRGVTLGDGTVVCPHASITTNVVLGRHVHVNLQTTIGHDCRIGDHTTISPGVNISGEVVVGRRVLFGTNAAILPGITIGDDARVGAGAVVTRDVAPGTTVTGIPARAR